MRARGRSAIGLVAAALVPYAAPVRAQEGGGIAGRWAVTWAQAVRHNRDGTLDVQKWGDATLVLVAWTAR